MPVDVLVMHYTGMRSAAAAIDRLCDPDPGVSSHYVVDEDGTVFRLVDEAMRAAHAGVSFWRGMRDLNDRSVGIEIVNPGHEWGYRPFPAPQIDSVVALSRAILARHPIPAVNVVGHSDVAPDRKQDPGELFPWPLLASVGIGAWPVYATTADALASGPADASTVADRLRQIGYPLADDAGPDALATVVTAFQRRFRPARVDGRADRGTASIADTVARAYGPWRS